MTVHFSFYKSIYIYIYIYILTFILIEFHLIKKMKGRTENIFDFEFDFN